MVYIQVTLYHVMFTIKILQWHTSFFLPDFCTTIVIYLAFTYVTNCILFCCCFYLNNYVIFLKDLNNEKKSTYLPMLLFLVVLILFCRAIFPSDIIFLCLQSFFWHFLECRPAGNKFSSFYISEKVFIYFVVQRYFHCV